MKLFSYPYFFFELRKYIVIKNITTLKLVFIQKKKDGISLAKNK